MVVDSVVGVVGFVQEGVVLSVYVSVIGCNAVQKTIYERCSAIALRAMSALSDKQKERVVQPVNDGKGVVDSCVLCYADLSRRRAQRHLFGGLECFPTCRSYARTKAHSRMVKKNSSYMFP